MTVSDLERCAFAIALMMLPACLNVAAVPALSAPAQAVRVEQSEPPAGAALVGLIEATHGSGCGLTGGPRGTLDGATAMLKEAAARRGATFVKVTAKREPYSGRDCFHQEFTLTGIGYRVASAAPRAPVTPAPVTPVPSATPVTALPSVASAAVPSGCAPPCSPGYECSAGVCSALCNPPCAPDQQCRTDRVCVPNSP